MPIHSRWFSGKKRKNYHLSCVLGVFLIATQHQAELLHVQYFFGLCVCSPPPLPGHSTATLLPNQLFFFFQIPKASFFPSFIFSFFLSLSSHPLSLSISIPPSFPLSFKNMMSSKLNPPSLSKLRREKNSGDLELSSSLEVQIFTFKGKAVADCRCCTAAQRMRHPGDVLGLQYQTPQRGQPISSKSLLSQKGAVQGTESFQHMDKNSEDNHPNGNAISLNLLLRQELLPNTSSFDGAGNMKIGQLPICGHLELLFPSLLGRCSHHKETQSSLCLPPTCHRDAELCHGRVTELQAPCP